MTRPSPRNSAFQSFGRFARSRFTTCDDGEWTFILRVTVSPIPTTILGKAVLMVNPLGEPTCANAGELVPKIKTANRIANRDNRRCFISFSPLE
jgi:hypothetical protein